MKATLVLAITLCVCFFLHGTTALPVAEVEEQAAVALADVDEVAAAYDAELGEHSERQKRATCDLLSGTGVNHSACAAHCILRGKRGGYCNGQAVCVCRN